MLSRFAVPGGGRVISIPIQSGLATTTYLLVVMLVGFENLRYLDSGAMDNSFHIILSLYI